MHAARHARPVQRLPQAPRASPPVGASPPSWRGPPTSLAPAPHPPPAPTVLTVRAHAAASHAKKGWERFTDAVIARLSQRRRGLVFLLWGRYAQGKGQHIAQGGGHHALECAHPSGLSASRGFFGCRHFSRTNALLEGDGQPPVDWQIE